MGRHDRGVESEEHGPCCHQGRDSTLRTGIATITAPRLQGVPQPGAMCNPISPEGYTPRRACPDNLNHPRCRMSCGSVMSYVWAAVDTGEQAGGERLNHAP